MAIWQFALDPVPAGKAEEFSRDDDSPRALELSSQDLRTLFFKVSAILPVQQAWAEDMRHWGDDKGDDITFFMSDTGIEAMQIRVDVRSLSLPFLEAICALARDFGWVFACETGEMIDPALEPVLRAIIASPAGHYVRDPEAFLCRVARDHRQSH